MARLVLLLEAGLVTRSVVVIRSAVVVVDVSVHVSALVHEVLAGFVDLFSAATPCPLLYIYFCDFVALYYYVIKFFNSTCQLVSA